MTKDNFELTNGLKDRDSCLKNEACFHYQQICFFNIKSYGLRS